jgi:LysW-gamma-L-lysine carboxypeptidase
LLGHIDTVPGEIEVRQVGHLLYGRGTVDAKGPLAAFVSAVAQVGPQPGKKFVVVGAVEEEAATSKGARHLLDKLDPDMVIIGEPSGWDGMTIGYKGRLLVDYELTQEIGHTAGPESSVCEQGVAFWQGVTDLAHSWNASRPRMFDQILPSLRSIHSEGDGFVETVRLTIGLRLPPSLETYALDRQLFELAGQAQVHFRGREAAFRASRTTDLARAFFRAIHARGTQPVYKVKSGTSDMNVVGPVWQCPILAYGPGDAALDHTPHEHIDLQEYRRSISVLADALQRL